MKLSFDQLMRLLLMVSGLVFFGVGIWMIRAGITAEGSIDLQSELLSGSIKTGSAGLFLSFFAFFMIIASVLFARPVAASRSNTSDSETSHVPGMKKILFGLYAATIAAYLILRSVEPGEKVFFTILFAGLLFASFLMSLLTFFFWGDSVEQSAKRRKNEEEK